MTKKGYYVLNSLISNGFVKFIDKVIVGLDKAVLDDYSNEIIELCFKHNIIYVFYSDQFQIKSSFTVAISWRWMIDINNTKLVVLHDSLLPKYRGFSPLVNSLINGEEKVGVTALFATDEYDKGDIILQKQIKVTYPIKISVAIETISLLYSEIILELFNLFKEQKELKFYSQNEDLASYSLWRDYYDYFINWNSSSENIKLLIDAVGFPYQGARLNLEKEIVIVNDASLVKDLKIEIRDVGKVIFFEYDRPVVVCGKGLLRIEDAVFEKTNESIFPLKKFRVKFT
jgi:methionyl-tRNA formyltransferase